MLLPEYLQRISEGAEQIASDLHNDIIRWIIQRIMRRLDRGDDYVLTAIDKWQVETLQEAGYLLEDIQRDILKKTTLQMQEIKAAFEDAGIRALEYDDEIYKAAGLSPLPLMQSPYMTRLMQHAYEATLGEWRNYTRTTANAAQQLFITECDKAYMRVASGAVSRTQALKEAVDTIATNGVYVTYTNPETGHTHRDTIETATARAVRTGVAQSTGDICMQRLIEMDWDIILVSAHIGARTGDGGQNPGNHLWWQGQYYSRTGRDKRFPNFYERTGYGTGEGLCGWNCRHSFGVGTGDPKDNPFKDIETEDNYRVERLNKRQRILERRIRATKRAVLALQEAVKQCTDDEARDNLQKELDRKSALLRKQNGMYNIFCNMHKLKTQDERLRVAQWDRAAAAKARAAANRYEKEQMEKKLGKA